MGDPCVERAVDGRSAKSEALARFLRRDEPGLAGAADRGAEALDQGLEVSAFQVGGIERHNPTRGAEQLAVQFVGDLVQVSAKAVADEARPPLTRWLSMRPPRPVSSFHSR